MKQSNKQVEQQKGQELVFPYVYGSLAFSMGKKGDSYTHKWICYVRGLHNEDLSYLIKKVVFVLHSSFENPIKEIFTPPYEIQQLGWGQFQILIQIHFNHPNMPFIEIPHMLKLHHTHSTGSQTSKKPLCSQVYDEIVFTEIDVKNVQEQEHLLRLMQAKDAIESSNMMAELQNNEEFQVAIADQPLKSITQYQKYLTLLDPEQHKGRLEDALRFIKGEISGLEEKMKSADMDIQKVYEDLYSKLS